MTPASSASPMPAAVRGPIHMTRLRSKRYTEGDIIAIPRADGKAVPAVISRVTNPAAIVVPHMFASTSKEELAADEFDELSVGNALRVVKTSDCSIRDGTWGIVGRLSHWDRAQWSVLVFRGRDALTDKPVVLYYSEENPVVWEKIVVAEGDFEKYPVDGISSTESVEKIAREL